MLNYITIFFNRRIDEVLPSISIISKSDGPFNRPEIESLIGLITLPKLKDVLSKNLLNICSKDLLSHVSILSKSSIVSVVITLFRSFRIFSCLFNEEIFGSEKKYSEFEINSGIDLQRDLNMFITFLQ